MGEEEAFRTGHVAWAVPVGHLWSGGQKTEWGQKGTQGHGHHGEGLTCMPHWPSLTAQVPSGGQGTAMTHVLCGPWQV